jgi:hypothetical protein
MAEPDWNPDTGGRSLAEILREAGIESANRAKTRRRWDDPEETGLRQRRAEAAADGTPGAAGYGRRRSDLDAPEPVRDRERRASRDAREVSESREMREPHGLREPREPREPRESFGRREPRRPPVDPSTAAIPGLRPDRKPGVPGGVAPERRDPERRDPERRDSERRDSDRRDADRRTADRTPQRSRPARAPRPEEQHPSTGPIPVVRADDIGATDFDSSPQESALAWLRFAGELVIALAVGIGVYFAATVLWQNIPYVAVVLVPVAVTGLVAGVSAWRQRMGREQLGARLLAVLVLAGTLLTIVPAASVIANR